MQLSEVLQEFGALSGFKTLETNENGVVHMTIHKVGDLFIDEKYRDESGNCVIIYLLRIYDRVDGNIYKRALSLCDYEPNAEFLVNPVLHRDQALGFAIKCPLMTFDLNVLQKVIHKLKDLQDRLAGSLST
ncbi:MAG: hypothetical protein LBQ23_03820 [Puniceicoccales bacterium]|jgi:hypothetical protein|nr:hypothetical protein [Puniceicoccales bacterium]